MVPLKHVFDAIKPKFSLLGPLNHRTVEDPFSFSLLSLDQLQRHARQVALRHKTIQSSIPDGLLKKLADNDVLLHETYAQLNKAIQAKQRISPASEWLLDNFHLIEEQMRLAKCHLPKGYSRKLPHLAEADGVGHPRVYDMALEIIAHVDGRVDRENITCFVRGYQSVTSLQLGEFWAIPIMLRLALIENLARVAGRVMAAIHDRKLANHWADQLLFAAENQPAKVILVAADMARSEPPMSSAFVAELMRRLRGQTAGLDIPLAWIEQNLIEQGQTSQQLVQLETHQQAANQVAVGASIGSLRFLSRIDWRDFVESECLVETELLRDPSGVYGTMDFATRDRYRHVVENLAAQVSKPEWEVARKAVAMAHDQAHDPCLKRKHVGYYLIDQGFEQLKASFQKQGFFRENWIRLRPHHLWRLPWLLYFGGLGSLTLLIAIFILGHLGPLGSPGFMGLVGSVVLTISLLLTSSLFALSVVHWVATLALKPHLLPRLDFSNGIPDSVSTLVVIPTLLVARHQIESLLSALEVRYLANRDKNLFFALLTDFKDAPTETMPHDDALVQQVLAGIQLLNQTYKAKNPDQNPDLDIFCLFHRPRVWNPYEKIWMGYERKRGKLEALNMYLRGKSPPGAFSCTFGKLPWIKYVITLDTDTQLPGHAARLMVGTMAHPLNEPWFDPKLRRVTEGYGILQPRVATNLPCSRRSLFVRLYGGEVGVDPYTRVVSDVYQDLFSEGSYVGKGIYDVDAFSLSLHGALPENLILSHDLIEGCYARSGLVSDVELFDEFPAHMLDDTNRRSRWIRGDWQIAAWLFPWVPSLDGGFRRNKLSLFSRWKIFDNLRRSLVPLANLLLLFFSWTWDGPQGGGLFLMGFVVLMILAPPLFGTFAAASRKAPETAPGPHWKAVGWATLVHVVQGLLAVVFLPFEVLMNLNAILRSLWRMLISRKLLLQWKSASDPRQGSGQQLSFFVRVMIAGPLAAVVTLGVLLVARPESSHSLVYALPVLVLWFFSPLVAWRLSQNIPLPSVKLDEQQILFLHRLSRKTWRFFETFVGPQDHWLPPDNFQEYPEPIVAHRTSPTNMGLSLLANLTAYDFGYLSVSQLLQRTSQSLATMAQMEKFRGHFYNWYDTQTLRPLLPQYVSMVDSGNLAGLLLTLNQGLREIPDHKIVSPQILSGLRDTLMVVQEHTKVSLQSIFAQLNSGPSHPNRLPSWMLFHKQISKEWDAISMAISLEKSEVLQDWVLAFQNQLHSGIRLPLEEWVPWFVLCQEKDPPSGETYSGLKEFLATRDELPTLRESNRIAHEILTRLDALPGDPWPIKLRSSAAEQNQRFQDLTGTLQKSMALIEQFSHLDYEFLYDKTQHLLSIGYNVTEHRRDQGFYDLLASEARLGSYVAIAQGTLPEEHWFALGRLLTTWNHQTTLLSWSGSMFEYLMPLLVMPTFKETLLDRTYETAVARQISYGQERGVPWGISESGYNTTDVNLNYQYRAFGVPGLGLKRGLVDDLVIAPYASTMALMVFPEKACENLQRMHGEGWEGAYGFYEAIDFTPSRISGGQSSAIIRSYMAHHHGMSFLALSYLLHDRLMPKRFSSHPQCYAMEMLLHERVPKATRLYPHAPEVSGAHLLSVDHGPDLRVISTPYTPVPEVHLLSNGRYSVMMTNSGGGYSHWNGLALTRWREDPTCDDWGTFCFIRDIDTGAVWSVTHQPSLKNTAMYEAIFSQSRAEYRRTDHGLEVHTEVAVSPEDDIEMRRFSLTNTTSQPKVIELTTYSEIVLAPQAMDEAHPAFANLFVQTEILPHKQSILCTRRPRSDEDRTPTLLHLMTVHGPIVGEASYETDRSRFIGRGRSIHDAVAMTMARNTSVDMEDTSHDHRSLSGAQGSVLDPIVAIRQRFVIEPEGTVKVHTVTGIGETRDIALGLVEKYRDRHVADRVFELAWTHRQVVLRQRNTSEADAQLFGRLASSILYANPQRRPSPTILGKNRRGQSGLWAYGISGDLPIILLRLSGQSKFEIVHQMIQAHGYWDTMGLGVDLVLLNEDHSGYRQEFQERLTSLINAANSIHQPQKAGKIYLCQAELMSEDDQILLQTVARAVLSDLKGTLGEQMNPWRRQRPLLDALVPTKNPPKSGRSAVALDFDPKDLQLWNGTGGFSPDGREYWIVTGAQHKTPAPWAHVIANQFFGSVVSESGAAYTWCENAHEMRLTPWHNDALTDRSGEAFYLRDEETGAYWSPTPLPAPGDGPTLTKHGFGYSVFTQTNLEIHSQLTSFVAIDAPVKIALIKLKNLSDHTRQLSLTGYCEWVLGKHRSKSLLHLVSEVDFATGAVFVRNPYHGEFGGRIAFVNISEKNRTLTCDRSEFIGRNGHLSRPAAMERRGLSGRIGAGLDPCTALQSKLELKSGEEREIVVVLGMARDVGDAHTLLLRFSQPHEAHLALDAVKRHWRRSLGAVQIETPDRALNIIANGWLLYQTLACRLWARSGYYQSGGAFGFRDQLQDTMALLHHEPVLLRHQLLLCASRQYREGDVQHWWHPPGGLGVRTHFSDDYLWLPLAASRYVWATGDTGVLGERIHFLEGRQVKVNEEAYIDQPSRSDESATFYEHCVRAIRFGLKFGKNGLPLMGCGDWNDGMNLVGARGKGESVWLGFFLYDVLTKFAKIATLFGDPDFAAFALSEAHKLKLNLENNAWDGAWYRRAYFDEGQPLGSKDNQECQIDSLPQSWSVLSGAGDPQRARLGMEAVDQRLVDRQYGIIKLFDPPFDHAALNPGYIKGYVPGVRENGGQYTHAAIWMAMAFAAMGDRKRAWELTKMINPLSHTDTPEKCDRYKVEPYVMAADVYAVAPHEGRGGWTWYTGSAGWMYRLILESILGLRLEVDRLVFDPCLPEGWDGFRLTYRYRETTYQIEVRVSGDGVRHLWVDGVEQDGHSLLLVDDHKEHGVVIVI